jgi:hypothetical protein
MAIEENGKPRELIDAAKIHESLEAKKDKRRDDKNSTAEGIRKANRFDVV